MPEKYVHTEKGISVLLDTYCFREPLLFLCVCFTHHVFIRPYAVVPQSLLQTRIAATEKAIFLPSFVPKLTPPEVLGGLQQWSVRKLLWTKAAFSGTSPPRTHLPQSCTRPVPAQWTSKQRAVSEYLWEKLSHKQSTFLGSFHHLPPLPVNKPQMFFVISQIPTALSLLDNQPEYNPPKYLHPSSLLVFCILNANRPFFMVRVPASCPQASISHSPHLRSRSTQAGPLKPCSGQRHSSSKHRCM